MEVTDHLVHAEDTLKTTTLAALCVNALRIALTVALLNVLASAECPLLLCIGLADLVASVAAARFAGTGGSRRTVTLTTVFGVEMFGALFLRVTA